MENEIAKLREHHKIDIVEELEIEIVRLR
jgi:hypothetical protein